ncbi:MAG: GNAT family N-acetyltransferase [Segniliparus sp.]|uniref:GNAT family N-acetyltransferase n=1 Tax=Segniliparus sp. TaxID=2804064 RepID=UPI003F3BAAB9
MTEITVARLGPDDWKRHREIRLEALRTAPEMFSSRLEDMVEQPEPWWRELMGKNRYCYALSGEDVVGMAGLATPTGEPAEGAEAANALTEALPAGTGMLISVFVSSRARGLRLGERLSAAVIGQAEAEGLAELYLDVVEHNTGARKIYERLGFVETGRRCPTDKRELEMVLALGAG